MNDSQIKEKILADIEAAKEKGYTLIADSWGDGKHKCACALGCVNVISGHDPDNEDGGGVEITLQVSADWITSFIDGYDSNGIMSAATVPAAWKMGQEIRQETQPLPLAEFMERYNND